METKLTVVETKEVYRSITINYPDEMNNDSALDNLLNHEANSISEYVSRLKDNGITVRIDKKVLDSTNTFEVIDGETITKGEDYNGGESR